MDFIQDTVESSQNNGAFAQYSEYEAELDRSSHQRCSIKKGVLRNFKKFTGKYLCQSLFFNKAAGLRPQAVHVNKKRLWHRCFSVNFAKFLRTPFLQNTSGRLLLLINRLSFPGTYFCVFWKN